MSQKRVAPFRPSSIVYPVPVPGGRSFVSGIVSGFAKRGEPPDSLGDRMCHPPEIQTGIHGSLIAGRRLSKSVWRATRPGYGEIVNRPMASSAGTSRSSTPNAPPPPKR